MNVYDVVVVGGNMGGTLIAAAYAAHGRSVAVIEPQPLASAFMGGFKYLRHNDELIHLLIKLGVRYSILKVRGGVITAQGDMLSFPGDIAPQHLENVSKTHYLKTRGTLDGWTPQVMNFGGTPTDEVDADIGKLVEWVDEHCEVIRAPAKLISGQQVGLGNGVYVCGKQLVSTVPLPILCRLLRLDEHEKPVTPHQMLNTVEFQWTIMAGGCPWDYVYTPYLKRLHRVSVVNHKQGVWQAEWNGDADTPVDDLEELAGVEYISPVRSLPGHLLPIEWRSWKPDPSLRLMGRFAEWNPRGTVDQTVATLMKELT